MNLCNTLWIFESFLHSTYKFHSFHKVAFYYHYLICFHVLINYQEVEKEILPQNIKIIAVENNAETIIKMEFKSISINQEVRFPFRIPSGFEEIVIK